MPDVQMELSKRIACILSISASRLAIWPMSLMAGVTYGSMQVC